MENRERISLVLLDMIMPKKNGKEVSEAIRKVEPPDKNTLCERIYHGYYQDQGIDRGRF